MLKIKKGDKVKVIAGSDKGREGVVEKVFPKKGTAFVPGVSVYKKHISSKTAVDGKGGVYELSRPISIAKLAFIDPKTNKTTRVRFEVSKDKKVRVAVKSKQIIDKI